MNWESTFTHPRPGFHGCVLSQEELTLYPFCEIREIPAPMPHFLQSINGQVPFHRSHSVPFRLTPSAPKHRAATDQDILDSRACNCNKREIAEGIRPALTCPKAQARSALTHAILILPSCV